MASTKGGGGDHVIRVKATVNREKKSVVFVEADEDLVDVLFSYLTLPMATIINLSRKHPPAALSFGCLDNLYRSVENLESRHFRTPKCKEMLLRPRNGAGGYCQHLKLNIEDDAHPRENKTPRPCCLYYCNYCKKRLYGYEKSDHCECSNEMAYLATLCCEDAKNGLFVKRVTRLVISDDLRVKPASTAATLSFLSEHSVGDATAVQELAFDFGVDEALVLLKLGLVSQTPLSDVIFNKLKAAKQAFGRKASSGCLHHQPLVAVKLENDASPQAEAAAQSNDNTPPVARIKLVYSRAKKMVLYAETGEDFVDFLFSFLVMPLGQVFKQMLDDSGGNGMAMISPNGCVQNLYGSVKDLVAEECLVRGSVLQNPSLAAGFGYPNHPLGFEEITYFVNSHSPSSSIYPVEDETKLKNRDFVIRVRSPAADGKGGVTAAGYVAPSMWTVTDDLNVSLTSPASTLALLRKLNVPFSELEVRTIQVGKQQAFRLLVASLTSGSPLTDVFFGQLD